MRTLPILAAALSVLAASHARPASTFGAYENHAFARLNARQDAMIRQYNLTRYQQFHWSQKKRELLFTDDGKVKVIADVQFVGNVSAKSHRWLWAWANPSIMPSAAVDTSRLRQFGRLHRFVRLTQAEWPATPLDGWKMTAIAEQVLNAKGAYRTEDRGGYTYMVITSIHWANEARTDKPTRVAAVHK